MQRLQDRNNDAWWISAKRELTDYSFGAMGSAGELSIYLLIYFKYVTTDALSP